MSGSYSKPLEQVKADLLKMLNWRVLNKVPVPYDVMCHGPERYVRNMSERFARDWHSGCKMYDRLYK
jgi:hypothetical protein